MLSLGHTFTFAPTRCRVSWIFALGHAIVGQCAFQKGRGINTWRWLDIDWTLYTLIANSETWMCDLGFTNLTNRLWICYNEVVKKFQSLRSIWRNDKVLIGRSIHNIFVTFIMLTRKKCSKCIVLFTIVSSILPKSCVWLYRNEEARALVFVTVGLNTEYINMTFNMTYILHLPVVSNIKIIFHVWWHCLFPDILQRSRDWSWNMIIWINELFLCL